MEFKDYLVYKSAEVPDDCIFKISPSQFSKFVDKCWQWYETEVKGENKFEGNTSSYIGTIVHAIAAAVAQGMDVDKEAIEDYIDSKKPSEDYDPDIVRKCYPEMATRLVNDYVLQNQYLAVEEEMCAEFKDCYYVAGTLDRISGTGPVNEDGTENPHHEIMIEDYKTYNSKTKPKSIPSYYKYQLLVYAAIARANGYNPTRIRLVYINRPIVGEISEKTGKRLKSYPSEVTVLTESITEDDFTFIEGMLELAVDSLEASKKYPELTHVIFHDNRLKEK